MDYGRSLFTCSALCVLLQPACELVVDFDRGKLDAASSQGPTPVPRADDGAVAREPDAASADGALVQPEPPDAAAESDAEASAPDAGDGGAPQAPDAAPPDAGVAFSDAAQAADAEMRDAFADAEPLDAFVDDAEPADALANDADPIEAGEGEAAVASDAAAEDAALPEPGFDGGV